jgi:hypothetical protein
MNTCKPKGADKAAKPIEFFRNGPEGKTSVTVKLHQKSTVHLSPEDFAAKYDVVAEEKGK